MNKECTKNWLEERQAQEQIHTYLMLYNCFLPFFITDRFHCHLREIHWLKTCFFFLFLFSPLWKEVARWGWSRKFGKKKGSRKEWKKNGHFIQGNNLNIWENKTGFKHITHTHTLSITSGHFYIVYKINLKKKKKPKFHR